MMAGRLIVAVLIVYGANANMNTVQDVCPYNKFCTSEPLKIITPGESTSCCVECSCDLDCHTVGNCCPDAPDVNPEPTPLAPCVYLGHYLNFHRNFTIPVDVTNSYRIIDTCPDSMQNLTVALRCRDTKHLAEYVLVSSPDSKKIYRNKHCATCHDETNVKPWTLHAYECNDLLLSQRNFKSFEERDTYILNHCSLWATPPNTEEPANCFNDGIVGGNIIGKCSSQEISSPRVETACTSYRTSFRLQQKNLLVYHHGQTYANPFCFMCNHPNVSSTDCETTFTTGDNRINSSLLLPFDVTHYDDENERCAQSELFDNRTNQCRELHCPFGTIPNYGDCVYPLQDIADTSIQVYFSMQLFTPLDLPPRFVLHASILHKIELELRDRVKGHCGTCDSSLFKTSSSSLWFYLKVVLKARKSCEQYKLIAALSALTDKGFADIMVLRGKEYIIVVKPTFDQNKDTFTMVSFDTGKHVCSNPVSFNMSMEPVCPNILITRKELQSIGLNATGIAAIFDKSVERENVTIGVNDDDAAAICVGEYFGLQLPAPHQKENSHLLSGAIFLHKTGYYLVLCVAYLLI